MTRGKLAGLASVILAILSLRDPSRLLVVPHRLLFLLYPLLWGLKTKSLHTSTVPAVGHCGVATGGPGAIEARDGSKWENSSQTYARGPVSFSGAVTTNATSPRVARPDRCRLLG